MNEIPDFLRVANRDKPMPYRPPTLVHSYSALNCYDEVCPHQYWHRYILKDIKFVESPQIKAGNEGHALFEQRLASKRPLPPDRQTWEAFVTPLDFYELKIEQWYGVTQEGSACESRAPAVWLRGKLDCAIVNQDRAYMIDWKFSKPGNSKWEKPFELEVGALLLQAKHPQVKQITAQFAWINENKLGERFDVSNTRKTWAKINDIVTQINANQHTGEFAKRRSGLCGWCPVKNCEYNTSG